MCSRRARTRSPMPGTRRGSAPSAATTTCRARTVPVAVRTVARRHGAGDLDALVDARAGLLRRARQGPDPARRVQRAVVVGAAGVEEGAPQRRRQLVALDQLGREAVGAQRLDVAAHVLGLLLGGGDAQEAGAPHRVAGAELRGQGEDLLLGLERARVEAARPLGAVALAGVVVEGGQPGDQEAAVAAAGAGRDRAALEHDRLDAVLGEPPRARQAADPRPDHAGLDLHVPRQRRARLVGLVEPERARHRTAAPASTRSPCSASVPASIASRRPRISRSMKVRLCSVSRRFAVSSPARTR